MKIKTLELKNGYKRFHHLKIDLGDEPKRIIALIGPNGCGKSSAIDGMLFLTNAHGKIGDKDSKDFKYHSLTRTPNYNYQNVNIEFDSGNFSTVFNNLKKSGKEKTIFSFRSSYRYNSNLKITQAKATNEIRLNSYGATTSSDLDSKMEDNYRRLNIKYYNYLNTEDCKPSHAKQKIIGDLNQSISKCLDLEIISIGNIEDDKGTLFFKKSDQDVEFEFNVLSSGEKEVVDILLDLYLRQDEYNDTIYLIDEPELHINTSIQRKLLIEIDRLIGENCQIWIITHSIGFMRALQCDFKDKCQIIQFKENIPWATEPQTLVPIKTSVAKWKEIFETALDDLNGLVSPKRIIYCEGKDMPKGGRENGFDAKVFNCIFANKYDETLFVSSGGNTELEQRSQIAFAILSKAISDLEIFVFKDRDISSGKPNDENDRQIYLKTNPERFRVMKRWEIENYLFDKEVLKKYCLENQKEFDEASYDSFVTNIIDQNLKDEITRIKNFCNITTSVSPENFKFELAKVITEDMHVYTELEGCIFNRK